MKTGILGVLIGSALFVGGFIHHDKGQTVYLASWDPNPYIYADPTDVESMGFAVGMAGTMIMTASVKHLWNQRKPKTKRQPVDKFRETLQILAGAGLIIAGAELHELKGEFDQTYRTDTWNRSIADGHKEHLGFFVGAVGTAMLTNSAKNLWDGRKSALGVSQALEGFRLKTVPFRGALFELRVNTEPELMKGFDFVKKVAGK